MRIALIGGTGKEGKGLALRWARAGHEVYIGSRDAERGRVVARELSERVGATIQGGDNQWVAAPSEVVVLTVPYTAHRATLEELHDSLADKIVVDITVPLQPPAVREVHLPEGHAAALEAQLLLPDTARLVATLHHVSSVHLQDLDHVFDSDVLFCTDHIDVQDVISGLLEDLGMRALSAGPLRNAVALESLTPVLLYINKKYKSPGAGFRITGLS